MKYGYRYGHEHGHEIQWFQKNEDTDTDTVGDTAIIYIYLIRKLILCY